LSALRKTVTLIIIIYIYTASGAFAAHQTDGYIGDMRLAGMAGAYTAVANDHNTLFRNPAGLGMLQTGTIGTMIHYTDLHQSSGAQFYEPIVMPQFFFTGSGWGISISSIYDLNLENGGDDEDRIYTISKINNVDLGFGVNLGMFSAGAAIHASKITEASNVNISDPGQSDFFADFFQQVFLNDYNGNNHEEGESVLLRAGLLFDTGIFALGAHHDEILDVMAWSQHQDLPVLEDLLKDIYVGVSVRNPRLDRYGRRNILRFLGALDVDHIGCDDHRMLRMGVESGIYFTDSDRIVLRAGYKEHMPRIQDLMFGAINPSQGTVTVGAGLEITALSLQASYTMPAKELFTDEKDEPRFGISAGFVF